MKSILRNLFAALVLASASAAIAADAITVYKTPNCGCCVKWVEYLQKEGFTVETHDRRDLTSIKKKAGVTPQMASCHTSMVDGYVIEGHVPAAAIRKLLQERPDTRGLSVPGMPENSPGMGEMDGKLQTFTLEGKLYSTD
jgi:hypothetical protein